ncbi:MAG TPA: FtsX-like permease family protein [Candidatus Saccharimonadales bacterium]|nr:FtsX-like permease family protein [Candidatus Saccharimonadales bacterium]
MNVFSRGVRNAFRNGIRTVAIVGMLGLSIGLALAMLLANQAIGQKIKKVQQNIGNTITVAPVGIRGFQGGGTPLTSSQVEALKGIAHVTTIDETLTDRITSSDSSLTSAIDAGSFGNRQFRIERDMNPDGSSDSGSTDTARPAFTPPITVVGTTNPGTAATSLTGGTATLTDGALFDGTKDAAVAVVGRDLASKNSLKVGSTFTAYSTTFTVVGIVDSGSTFSNNVVAMPLSTLQRLSSQSGDVTAATVHIDSAVNLDAATTAVKNKLGSSADVTNDADNAKTTLSSLDNIRNVSLFSLFGAAGAAAVIILLTMVMIVRERRREIGVLKAIGGSNLRVMLQFTVEALTLTVLAAAAGIIIGSLAATPVTKMLANNSNSDTSTTVVGPGGGQVSINTSGGMRMRGFAGGPGGFRARFQNNSAVQGVKNLKANVDASILLYGFGGALLIAAIGSTAAAGLIAKVRPAEVMRVE